jgi:lysozyme
VKTVPGIDVSYWQAEIDWPAVRATGQVFTFIKATEGLSYTDPTFSDNWRGAKATGFLRGAYCLFHPNQDAMKQAQRFLAALKDVDDEGELPCSLDLEVVDGVANSGIINGARAWLEEVEQTLGRKPMIYSGVSFLDTNFTETGGRPPSWASDYALWLGWFPGRYSAGMSPLMPGGWSQWAFWQYGGTGHLSGIKPAVDQDLFNGTVDELLEFARRNSPKPEPKTHVVVEGESLQSIADAYSVTLGALVRANPQLIKPGDQLTIPA